MPETPATLLERFVAHDTVSHRSNLGLAEEIADLLDRPGVRVIRLPSPEGTKANLCVILGPDPDPATRDGLVLSGHMDVVPADEPEWTTDPFQLADGGDRWIGRGTSDMKGFLAVAVHCARALDPTTLRHPLVLLLTYDEELGTLGAHRLATTWPKLRELPRATLIGEPTSMQAVRMHKGHLKLRLHFAGVPAHSGYPHLGRNAIEPAGRAIVALAALREALSTERPPLAEGFPDVPYVALNVGEVHGGTAINIVPDQCRIDLGVRLLPTMATDSIVERVQAAVDGAVGPETYRLEILGDSPPLLTADTASIHTAVAGVAGRCAPSVSFATDGGWLQTAGLECVICGPGSIEVAHKPNEWVPKADLVAAEDAVRRLIAEYTT